MSVGQCTGNQGLQGHGLHAPRAESEDRPWTLMRVYRELKKPEILAEGRSPKTLADYELHIRRFDQFWVAIAPVMAGGEDAKVWEGWGGSPDVLDMEQRINNPLVLHVIRPEEEDQAGLDSAAVAKGNGSGRDAPLLFAKESLRLSPAAQGEKSVGDVTRQHLVVWRNWLMDQSRGRLLSARSANKHVGTIQAVLRTAQDHGIVAGVPRVAAVKHRRGRPKLVMTLEQLGRLHEACRSARWPRLAFGGGRLPFCAAAYWRVLVVLWSGYGMRTQELVAYERGKRSLVWRGVFWQAETPSDEGQAENEDGWLVYTPQKQERHKPEPIVLPLSPWAAAHLRSIRPPGEVDLDSPVIPFPHCGREFYGQWAAILDVAGVRPKRGLDGKEREYEISHLRKTCKSHYAAHAGKEIADVVTGHAARDVSDRHYINYELALVAAVRTLPVPDEYRAIPDEPRERQGLLF